MEVMHVDRKGWGLAVKSTWLASEANLIAYMNVDLSTNLSSFMPLVAPLATGHSEIAIGSGSSAGAVVTRSPGSRILILGSRSYPRSWRR